LVKQQFMMCFILTSNPTPFLPDKTGKELFRHTGYLSYNELDDLFGFKP